jgi:hypothetical protein
LWFFTAFKLRGKASLRNQLGGRMVRHVKAAEGRRSPRRCARIGRGRQKCHFEDMPWNQNVARLH